MSPLRAFRCSKNYAEAWNCSQPSSVTASSGSGWVKKRRRIKSPLRCRTTMRMAGGPTIWRLTSPTTSPTWLRRTLWTSPIPSSFTKAWFRDRKVQKVPPTVERTEDSVLVTYDQPKDEIGFQSMILNPNACPWCIPISSTCPTIRGLTISTAIPSGRLSSPVPARRYPV